MEVQHISTGKIIPIKNVAVGPSWDASPHQEVDFRFHTMVKPTGAQCNLDCTYCYYLHKEDLLDQPKAPRMKLGLLEEHVRQYIEAQSGDKVVFSWQGGEPTLMKIDFFEHVLALQQKYKKPGQRIENDLQTNGTLIDEAWCQFLKKNDFLVGLSVDGPANLHDQYRVNKGGMPTHARIMETVQMLHQFQIPFNALCVVNRSNARRPIDVYRFLRDEVRPRIIQFIPGLEPHDFRIIVPGSGPVDHSVLAGSRAARPGHETSIVTDWSVDPEDWGYFLNRIWDEWLRRDFGKVFIDQFENVISQLFGHGAQQCVSAKMCGRGIALEYNGDLYSCDHFVYPEHKLGNILQTHEGSLAYSAQQEAFSHAKYKTLPNYCTQCSYLDLCWGGCPKNRIVVTPTGENGLNYLCEGLKLFYRKATISKAELSRRLNGTA